MGLLLGISIVVAVASTASGLFVSNWSPLLLTQLQQSVFPAVQNSISALEYDKQKNCTDDLSMRPTSIEYLTHFNCGNVSIEDDGTVSREFTLFVEENQEIQISDIGHVADAWTFNGTIPGPTLRVSEGDHVKITVFNSPNSIRTHSMHMHSIHASEMDGVQSNPIPPGGNFTYDFIAQPFGLFPYHCHIDPIADHINRGLYGVLIIDPKTPRVEMPEMVMMMNGYDLDYDQEGMILIRPADQTDEDEDDINISMNATDPMGMPESTKEAGEEERDNEIYTVNGKAFDYVNNPIALNVDQKYRVYLVNMLEFDLINSFHVHGALFDYYPSGTSINPDNANSIDVIILGQGDRGIVEFEYKYPGKYMFHAHVTEFTDLGWMGFFDVQGAKIDQLDTGRTGAGESPLHPHNPGDTEL